MEREQYVYGLMPAVSRSVRLLLEAFGRIGGDPSTLLPREAGIDEIGPAIYFGNQNRGCLEMHRNAYAVVHVFILGERKSINISENTGRIVIK